MDIEKIEKFLSELYTLLERKEAELPFDKQFQFVQCQLLLHIYKKLESIDDSLIAAHRARDKTTSAEQ